jgi:membrane protein involved in colicin uptake
MTTHVKAATLAIVLAIGCASAWAKIPPPPPLDEKGKAAAEEKKAKDAAAAEKAKADQAAAEERTIKNYQANMKKMGKPIPKPTPVVAATPPQIMPAPAGGKAAPTPGASANAGAVNAKGHEKGAMTPQGNTPPKGNEMPTDAKKKSS